MEYDSLVKGNVRVKWEPYQNAMGVTPAMLHLTK